MDHFEDLLKMIYKKKLKIISQKYIDTYIFIQVPILRLKQQIPFLRLRQ